MAIADLIREQYPSLAFLINNPEIGPLLREAVDPNKGFSPQTFQAKLYQTKWWRSQSATGREWLIKAKTDPGTAKLERSEYSAALMQAASRYGIVLNKDQLVYLTELGLGRGTAPDSPWMLRQFSQLLASGAAKAGPGMRQTAAQTVKQMAKGDYFYRMSSKNAQIWGDRIAQGKATLDDVRAEIADRTLEMYPQFATGLRQGRTMAEMTDGHRQIIADELELDPDIIDLSEGRWSAILGRRDSKGNLRPMTAFETLQLARQDPRFWRTGKGKQMDSEWSKTILAMFGKRAPMGISG